MRGIRSIASLCAVALLANSASAWNQAGQLVVALIAYDVMDAEDCRSLRSR
jgi:hypothetical protein